MPIDVVTVTLNQHAVLRACLESVRKAMEQVDGGEIVVVDNASTDATPRMLADEFPEVRVVRNDANLFYTLAVNQGARATKSEFLFLLNDDTIMPPDLLRTLLDFMRAHPRCGAVGPVFQSPSGEPEVSSQRHPTVLREIAIVTGLAYRLRDKPWAHRFVSQYPSPMPTMQVDWVCGGAILLRRKLMEELGLHDEGYLFYRDDPDIGRRVRDAGWEVWYCAETRISHYQGKSTARMAGKVDFDVISMRSRRHFHRKFHGFLGAAAVECADAVTMLVYCPFLFLRGDAAAARRCWERLRALFRAFRPSAEERLAREAHRHAQFNGLGADPGSAPRAPAEGASAHC